MDALKRYWQGLSRREQSFLLIGMLAFGLWLLEMGVRQPMVQALEQRQQRNTTLLQQWQQVQQLAVQLRQREQQKPRQQGALSQWIDQASQESGLRMARFQPASNGEVLVRFEAVDFAQLLDWMARLEGQKPVAIRELGVLPKGEGGLVNATVRLGELN